VGNLTFTGAQLTARFLANGFFLGAQTLTKSLAGNSATALLLDTALTYVKASASESLVQRLAQRLVRAENPPDLKDLSRAVGVALQRSLTEIAEAAREDDDEASCQTLLALARAACACWESLTHEQQQSLKSGLADLFAVKAEQIEEVTALSPQVWEAFLERAAETDGVVVSEALLASAASHVVSAFPRSLRQVLLEDQASGGQSYSALMLMILGEVSAAIREGQQEDRLRHAELLARFDQLQARLDGEQVGLPDAMRVPRALPSGTLTFLFTDIEGSTKLWERYPEGMRWALARHDDLLRSAIQEHHGTIFKTVGDAFYAVFPSATEAVAAALHAQRALVEPGWGETGPLCVRMGLHTGVAEERDNDYFGPTLNRVARLHGIGHGRQTLLSQTTYEIVCECLPSEASLRDLGMHRLKDLAEPVHVWQLLDPALPSEFPALKSLDYLPTNLPQQFTSFIGREKEMAEIKELIGTARLLTLTGTGGTGKTRLALQVAAEVLEQYRDGVWLVELAPVADPARVPQAVAETLGVKEVAGEPITRSLLSYIKDRQMLLVLDNCEHLLEASARLAEALLKSCARVRVLVSSRESLGIAGESAYRVPSMSVPDSKQAQTPEGLSRYESVRLFIERAKAAKSDFTVTPQNATSLASVCQRLDGVPLAIELAAARVRAMPLEQIEVRLDNRFRLLTGGSRTALPRQQTLRALIDWSYDLLNDQEKILLHRLSVFAGGWTLEAAEAVCAGEDVEEMPVPRPASQPADGDGMASTRHPTPHTLHPDAVFDLLTSLVDKSLVVYEEREGNARYRLLETVRQYAAERLQLAGETAQLKARHRDYCLALAEEAAPQLSGPDQQLWLQRLEMEHDNLRAALAWCIEEETGAEAGLRLSGLLWWFWNVRCHWSEGREALKRALGRDVARGRTADRAAALNGAGFLATVQGDYTEARAQLEESLRLFRELDDRKALAFVLNNLGNLAIRQGDDAGARALYEESIELARQVGDRRGLANTLSNLGHLISNEGDEAGAQAVYEESLRLFRELGHKRGVAFALNNLGTSASTQGNYAVARTLHQESLALRTELGDAWGITLALYGLAFVATQQGDDVTARTLYEEILRLDRELGDPLAIASALNNLADTLVRLGDVAAARTLYEESLGLFREAGEQEGVAESLAGLAKARLAQSQTSQAVVLALERPIEAGQSSLDELCSR
jgi:predicted ATPase/class 3 adenylate cyclase/Tfp pilus assembly protein PilF